MRLLVVYALTCIACYLWYLPFTSWSFLRFLLPALPVLLILAVVVARSLLERIIGQLAPATTLAIVLCVATASWNQTIANGVLDNERSMRRFVDVPRYISSALPARAIVLTRLYSGSVRYYGNRPTLRWDMLPSSALDEVVSLLWRRGYHPYIIIEGEEDVLFAAQFAGQQLGRLDWSPRAEYRGLETVRVYDPSDRGAAAHSTETIPASPLRIPRD